MFLANDLGAIIWSTSSGNPSWSFAVPRSVQLGISCAVKKTLAPLPPAVSSGLYLPKLYLLGFVSTIFVFKIKLPKLNCSLAQPLGLSRYSCLSALLRSMHINVVGS